MDRATAALSRRNILFGLAGAVVCAAIATPMLRPFAGHRARRLLAGNPVTRHFLSLADAGREEWTAQVGSTFSAEGDYRLRLAGVEPLPSSGARPASLARDSAFLAVFEVAGGMTMAGNLIYTLSHPQYGALPVFLTQSSSPGRMAAVFN